jgi:diaminopimelate decarboxylase
MNEPVDEPRLSQFVPEKEYLEINRKGHLEFDGFDCVELAEKFETPLYVMSERKVRENYRSIVKAFTDLYPHSRVAYAYKANPILAALKILTEEGASAEVISTGELFLANCVGVKGSNIVFNGCNKDRKGIRLAIECGALINVDSFQEMYIIEEEARRLGKKARIGIRINPVVRTGTLSVWETALDNSKFGITLEKGLEAYRKARSLENFEIVGIHTHIGSQVESDKPYAVAMTRIMDFLHTLRCELDIEIEIVDIGGGIPVPFRYKDTPSVELYAKNICDIFNAKREEYSLGEPILMLEPGGSIIGTSTILLLTVGMIKREESVRKWALVDGGANINLRATQGWYAYQCFCCDKMTEKEKETINIAGPLCYAGDVLAYSRKLPILEEGDVLALLDCGAYTMAVMNRYNSYPLPAVVLLQKEEATIIRRRETFTDLLMSEELPL